VSKINIDIKITFDDPTQFGNAEGCSTTHYLVKLKNKAYKSTDAGIASTVVTIDYRKALDLVDHTILIQKLKQLGFRRKLIRLILSFLSNRSHYTKIKGKKSKLMKITCGVPQGTISGPKLFTILIKDVKCPDVQAFKFVDDKSTWILNFSETEKDKMVMNEAKCNVITFNF